MGMYAISPMPSNICVEYLLAIKLRQAEVFARDKHSSFFTQGTIDEEKK
jgi:hypothetical protein